MSIEKIKKELNGLADDGKKEILSRFFKSGKGQYGAGDKFIGVSVPSIRKIAKKYWQDLSLKETEKLLHDEIHEHRQTALFVLTEKFQKEEDSQEKIVRLYLRNTKFVNNWDLVDLSAPKILGAYLTNKKAQRKLLYKLAHSENLWEKRIAIISTLAFIGKNDFKDTLAISKILLSDEHDLIHKSVGWMLREVGKRDIEKEETFLKKYYRKMPRTMLRYAIEKFPEPKRQKYLKGEI